MCFNQNFCHQIKSKARPARENFVCGRSYVCLEDAPAHINCHTLRIKSTNYLPALVHRDHRGQLGMERMVDVSRPSRELLVWGRDLVRNSGCSKSRLFGMPIVWRMFQVQAVPSPDCSKFILLNVPFEFQTSQSSLFLLPCSLIRLFPLQHLQLRRNLRYLTSPLIFCLFFPDGLLWSSLC